MSEQKAETHTFQAEIQQLLDIVIHSLYTDRDIFVRELISNASDALEKLRHAQLAGEEVYDADLPLEINITTDDSAGKVTIQDFGIGMTRQELVENLGTIAHSGSKAFAAALKEAQQAGAEALNLIGQFGVGFYSAFMVANRVDVYTHSARPGGDNLRWSSEGAGSYEIAETDDTQRRGTKIVLHLKDDAKDFAQASRIEELIRRFSSFVPFPINLNGKRMNQVQALWTRNKSEIKPEEYTEFYKFQANAFDEPRLTLHFNADAPLAIQSLLFVPQDNMERFGMGRMDPGVALYCKKVLIDPKMEGLLPEWMRFVRGVIDSPDIPLNISRESMQDSALVKKINKVITGRFLKFLGEEADKRPDSYAEFYKHFGVFIKEGVATDMTHRERLSKLLRFESSLTDPAKTTSLEEYVGRMKEEQKEIYYLHAPKRSLIENGPYLEAFRRQNLEVLFLLDPIDEFVANNLGEFDGKRFVSADQADINLEDVSSDAEGERLEASEVDALNSWLKEQLGDRVAEVRASRRLVDSPCLALNSDKFMTSSMRRMMKAMNQEQEAPLRVDLEINPAHPLVRNLAKRREDSPELAGLLAEQMLDTALAAAGFLEDPRTMVDRLYRLMERASTQSPGNT